jgi:hypothetical protein
MHATCRVENPRSGMKPERVAGQAGSAPRQHRSPLGGPTPHTAAGFSVMTERAFKSGWWDPAASRLCAAINAVSTRADQPQHRVMHSLAHRTALASHPGKHVRALSRHREECWLSSCFVCGTCVSGRHAGTPGLRGEGAHRGVENSQMFPSYNLQANCLIFQLRFRDPTGQLQNS